MPNNTNLIIKNLEHHFVDDKSRKTEAIKDFSLTVPAGEFVAIVGPSGCGKSTLLKIIAGLIKPVHGQVETGGQNLAMVFQNFAIFPWLTVTENIEFGLKMNREPAKKYRQIVREKIEEVGLKGFEHEYPQKLSGGMRQRVGLARALAVNPQLLLMDEPFSSLDAFTAEKLRQELMTIWLKYKMTIVLVTHLIEEAVELADRIVVLSQRPAIIKSDQKVILPRPRDNRHPDFFHLVDKLAPTLNS